MCIYVSPGFQLTTGNRIIPGGPILIGLGAGMGMGSDGKIYDTFPEWDSVPNERKVVGDRVDGKGVVSF